MGTTRALLAFVFTVIAVSGGLHAYSTQGVDSALSGYGVPSSVVSGLTAVNMTYSGHSYVALYSGKTLYFLLNVSSPSYSFVLNSTSIYDVINGHAVNVSVLQSNLTKLSSQMKLFISSSSSAINDCLMETGLSGGTTCTLANACESCQQIPVCKDALDATDGPSGPMGKGIMAFESQYDEMNSSLSAFYDGTSGITSSNAQSKLAQVTSAFNNISTISSTIYMNPIFPPTANITVAQTSTCINYLSNMDSAPWYCNAIGFCLGLNYNYTKLTYMQGVLTVLNSLPIASSQVMLIADNASAMEGKYVASTTDKQQRAYVAKMLNTTLAGYGPLVNDTSALLTHVSNASLSGALATLKASYANAISDYATENLIATNQTLAAQYATLRRVYASENASYSSLLSLAKNNTRTLIELQMEGGTTSSDVSNLAFEEFALNNQLFSGGLGSLSALSSEASSISQRLSFYSVESAGLPDVARSIDGPIITSIAAVTGISYSEAVSLAPALGALISLLVGLALVALVMAYRGRMHKHHQVVLNAKTRKNWRIIFAILLAAVLLYVIATYSLVSAANASAPYSTFSASLASSSQVAVVVNGTATTELSACAASVRSALAAQGKSVEAVAFKNGLCTSSNMTGTVDSCMGVFANRGVPVIVISEAQSENATAYSLYGAKLVFSGPAPMMDACYVQYLVR